MRKLIRSKATKAFLTADGSWTYRIQEAVDFDKSIAAVAAQERLKLHDVELYYSFADASRSEWDFALPLHSTVKPPRGSSGSLHTPQPRLNA